MVTDRLLWMAILITAITFAGLALAFRSWILPLKAIVLSSLTLAGALGLTILVFQDGHGASLLGLAPVGATDIDFPVMAIALAFGLAVDYEMFVLASISEKRQRGASTHEATLDGLIESAPVITSTAVLMVLIVAGFLFSSVIFMKMIGFVLAASVLLDVYVTRTILLPAAISILGERVWWPGPRRR